MGDQSTTEADTPRRRDRQLAREAAARSRLGHFQLLEPLGSGGMGEVYSAYDVRLDRKVAIKLLRTDGDPERGHAHGQRLLREAQAMAKLSHPNVVPIYEVGIDDNVVFIAMEYVAGDTLAAWLKTERSWREIVAVFAQAGRGLAAAHDVGIVHRDFKPSNVLLDARGHVRVTDFGIAQVKGVSEAEEVSTGRVVKTGASELDGELVPPKLSMQLTEIGAIVGTPAYMSPEQFSGAAVDARSDQFSFCVALYDALFGKRPFPGRGQELVDNVLAGAYAKPDPASSVPAWLTAIVVRGLARDPDARFPSMDALVDALGRDPGRLRKRTAFVALAAVALAGGAALVGWRLRAGSDEVACTGGETRFSGVWDDAMRARVAGSFAASKLVYADASAQRAAAVLDDYRARWVAMHGDACRATRSGEQSAHVLDLRMACLDRHLGEVRALTTILASASDAKTIASAVDAASALGSLAGCADTTALLQPDAEPTEPARRARRAELRDRLDELRAQSSLGRSKDILASARTLVADARASSDTVMLAGALRVQGTAELQTGDLKHAEATLGEAVRRARQLNDADAFVEAASTFADALQMGGLTKGREALGVVRLAKAVVDDSRDPAVAITLLTNEANILILLAHKADSLPILDDAGERCRRTLGEDSTLYFQIQRMRALALNADKKASHSAYEALIARAAKTFGPLHPTTIHTRLEQCRSLTISGDDNAAIPCYEAVLPDADRVLGRSDRTNISDRSIFALSLLHLGKTDRAMEVYADAYARIPADAWTDQWSGAADVGHALGSLELERGDFAAALAHCERARAATEQQHGLLEMNTCIAGAQLGLGDSTHALATLESVRGQLDRVAPEDAAGWRFTYARVVWAAKHDATQAREVAAAARSALPPDSRAKLDAWLAAIPR